MHELWLRADGTVLRLSDKVIEFFSTDIGLFIKPPLIQRDYELLCNGPIRNRRECVQSMRAEHRAYRLSKK